MNGNNSGTSIAELRMKAAQNNDTSVNTNRNNGNDKNNFTIEHLVADINNSIDEFSPSDDKSRDSESSNDSVSFKKNKKTKKNKSKSSDKMYDFIKEPIIIIVLYIVLSQDMIRNAISTYIPQINPSEETGNVTLLGVVIYGTILAVLYMIIKYITI